MRPIVTRGLLGAAALSILGLTVLASCQVGGSEAEAVRVQSSALSDGALAFRAVTSERPAAAVSWGPGRLDVFARTGTGALSIRSNLNGPWIPSNGWNPMGGPIEGGAEVVSWAPDRLDIFARLQDPNLYIKSWTGDVTGWIPSDVGWNSLGAPAGTLRLGHPSVTAWSPGTLQIVVPATDGSLYLKKWTGWNWLPSPLGWDSLGGSVVGSPKAVSWGPNRLDVFARLTDGNLYIKSLLGEQWIPSQLGWNSLGAPPNASVASDPVVVSWALGRLDILVMGTDGGLYLKSYVDGNWIPQTTWATLGTCVGPVSMVSWGPNRLDIFARQGNDGALYIKSWTGVTTGWIPSATAWNTLGVPAPNTRVTGPVTVVSSGVNELRILAPASDGALYEREWNNGWANWSKLSNNVSTERVETVPFWSSGIMYDESVLMVPPTLFAKPQAKLLWPASRILSVRDGTLGIEYQRDKDWTYDAASNTLSLPNGSHAASMTNAQLHPSGGVFFDEGHVFHDKQLNVSYSHAPGLWNGPIPTRQTNFLPRILSKLSGRLGMKIVLFGDSIAQGYSASGNETSPGLATPPFMRSWGDLVISDLNDRYGAPISFINKAVAGQDTNWGMQHVHTDVTLQFPDLVILAFGMNDGTEKMTAADFKDHIQVMMNDVRARNPDVEFILVSPTLPNPETSAFGTQGLYADQLASLAGPGVAFADMTRVHAKLLEKKLFRDMTGNGINHPNDFLVRWYAQVVGGLLL